MDAGRLLFQVLLGFVCGIFMTVGLVVVYNVLKKIWWVTRVNAYGIKTNGKLLRLYINN